MSKAIFLNLSKPWLALGFLSESTDGVRQGQLDRAQAEAACGRQPDRGDLASAAAVHPGQVAGLSRATRLQPAGRTARHRAAAALRPCSRSQ